MDQIIIPGIWSKFGHGSAERLDNGWGFMFMSTFFFISFNKFLEVNRYVPANLVMDKKKTIKWRNFCVSLCHSFLAGVMGLYLIIANPDMTSDFSKMVYSYSKESLLLEAFMCGYFLYDTLDMLVHIQDWNQDQINQFTFHHIAIFSCLLPSMYLKKYLMWSTIGTLAELGNVLLHLRQLFLFANVSKKSELFKFVSCGAIFSIFVTRIISGFVMTFCLLRDPLTLMAENPIYYPILTVCTLFLDLYSVYLLVRLVKSDYLGSSAKI